MIELMIAIVILTVGMLAMAAVITKMALTTERSRYMSTASFLASEKLEDLNRYPACDPVVAVSGGASSGSLTADVTQASTGCSTVETVDYFDTVQISVDPTALGGIMEVKSGKNAAGATVYSVFTHSPTGIATHTAGLAAPPANLNERVTYRRRWLIEANTPVVGVRRVTVRVTVDSLGVPLTFQSSMVRP
jgi:Tfp pilus assembly protein PilV